ncbi:MAG: L,D-transpeptidase family protein [Armatimonas sp.]
MPRSVAQAVSQYGPKMRAKFAPACKKAGIAFPPKTLTLLAFKEEKQLEIWSGREKLAEYSVLAASGDIGPKRREGDRQVPEGFYRLTVLNPNSAFHLSIRVDYPNAEDIAHKTVERAQMGGDIYIHGNAKSIGCLAMGDAAIEEIFPLIATVGLRNCRIIIAPRDLRTQPIPDSDNAWVKSLYIRLKKALRVFV